MAKSKERKLDKNRFHKNRRTRSREKKWSREAKKRKHSKVKSPAHKAPRTTSPTVPTLTTGSGFTSGQPILPSQNGASSPTIPLAIPVLGFGPPPSRDDNPYGPPSKFKQETIDSDLSLASVGGLEEQLNYLRKNVLFPMENVNGFAGWGMEVTKGVIFHGPPGTGKTLLAKALAAELSRKKKKVSFYMMKGGECFSKWVGESEKKLRQLFVEAKAKNPSIIFFDELDGLCPSREGSGASHQFYTNIVTTLLGQMDEVKRGEILVIGATNRLDAIDPACKRPGRFDQALAFLPPNEDGRKQILNIKLDKWGKNKPSGNVITTLANRTVGFTGADLEQLCREAFNCALDRQLPSNVNFANYDMSNLRVTAEDWNLALTKLGRSNSNVFGNSIYSGSIPDPVIQPLIKGIVSEINFKLEQFLPTVSENGSTSLKGFGIKSFLVTGNSEACLATVDTQILPAVMASFDAEKTPGFMISRYTVEEKKNLTTAFDQLTNCRKTCFLFLPRIDLLWNVLERSETGAQDLFSNFFDMTRGCDIIVVASALGGLKLFPEKLRDLFKGLDREYKVRKPNTQERAEFFNPIFDRIASHKDFEKNGKKGKDLQKLRLKAVQVTDNQEIRDVLNLQGELVILWNEFLTEEQLNLLEELTVLIDKFSKNKLDH